MKPLRLKLSAFGPFAGEQIVDFSQLNGRSFFLIHGPTGSGKTTLLDAMCYALYGKTSGNEREGQQMRSDHADPGQFTEVAFDFALGAEVYRVRRSPDQKRPKQRGEGFMDSPHKADLWCRTGCSDDDEGNHLVSQPSKVTEKIESLLGFKCDQFRQVIVLPQGQFRQVLTADSKAREALLQVLFQSEYYRRVETALKEAANALRAEVEEEHRQQAYVLTRAGVASSEELVAQSAELERQTRDYAEAIVSLQIARDAASANRELAAEVDRKHRELKESELVLGEIEARQPEHALKALELKRARSAESLMDVEAALQSRRDEANSAEAASTDAESHVKDAEARRNESRDALVREQGQEQERETAAAWLDKLLGCLERVDDLEKARLDVESLRNEIATVEGAASEASVRREKLAAQLESARAKHRETERAAERMEACRLALEQAAARERDRKRLDVLRKALEESEAEHANLQTKLDQATSTLATARARAQELQAAWEGGQAAILAGQLVEGKPCPVCGSCDHPNPVQPHGDMPSEAEVKAHRIEMERLEDSRDRSAKELHRQEQKVTESRVVLTELEAGLGDAGRQPWSAMEQAHLQAQSAFDAAAESTAALPALIRLMERLGEQETEAAVSANAHAERLTELRARLSRDEALLEERSVAFPADLRSRAAIELAVRDAQAHVKSLKESLEVARATEARAAEELARARAALESAAAARSDAMQRRVRAEEEFDRRLAQAGFDDGAAFYAARRSAALSAELEDFIRGYETSLASAQDRLERARTEVEGVESVDLEAADAALRDVDIRIQSAVSLRAQAETKLKTAKDDLDRLRLSRERSEKLEQEYAVLGRIAEVANSDNPRRMSFQRFVLTALLDEVLLVATKRLNIMSRGRYKLERRQDRGDLRTLGGLDLQVYDDYTGTSRSVATLSGGESFLASLSLALSLADVVQRFSGAMRLDTIFIDEGFGSLDSEALDLALRALIDLQESGRLVGIISHVHELKERIDARLEILADDRQGSRVVFNLR